MVDESETATWQFRYDEESKMYAIFWVLPGAKAALGSDEIFIGDVYTEAYARAIIADHNQARRVPGLVKALEAIATMRGGVANTGIDKARNIARAALIDAEVNDD